MRAHELSQFDKCPSAALRSVSSLSRKLCLLRTSDSHIHWQRNICAGSPHQWPSSSKMHLKMPNLILVFYLLQGLNNFISAQNSAPWRNRIQWVNNGQVFSLTSTGSEYNAPVASRRQSRVFLNSNRDAVRDRTLQIRVEASDSAATNSGSTALLGPDRMQYIAANSRAPGARQMQARQRLRAAPGTRSNATEYSGGGRAPAQGGNTARRAPAVANLQHLEAPTETSIL